MASKEKEWRIEKEFPHPGYQFVLQESEEEKRREKKEGVSETTKKSRSQKKKQGKSEDSKTDETINKVKQKKRKAGGTARDKSVRKAREHTLSVSIFVDPLSMFEKSSNGYCKKIRWKENEMKNDDE